MLNALTGPFGAGRRRSDRRDPSHPSTYSGPDRRRGDRRRRTTRGLLFAAFTLAGAGTPWTLNTLAPAVEGTVEVTAGDFRVAPRENRFDYLITEAATRYGVDVDLIRAVIRAESNFNPRAKSPVGASGLMQLMPALQQDFGITDPFDPRQNVMGGVRYLRKLLDLHGGNVARYGGIPPFRETRGYVKKITGWLKDTTTDVTE